MPLENQNSSKKVWGKRARGADGTTPGALFSELSPEEKIQRRKEERAEKKERDRTLSYFKSAREMFTREARGGDAMVLAQAVDGFFQELVKLLKADPSLHLLRNSTICQTIEVALQNSLLIHSKTLLFVLLGHISDVFVSPVASYVMETLLASLAQALSGLVNESTAEDDGGNDALAGELQPDGQGIHVGSGLPSTATLLSHLVQELGESLGNIVCHEVGARALRSLILMLGGFSIRGAPSPHSLVKFHDLLGLLGKDIMQTIEDTFSQEYQTRSVAETWLTVAQTPATSFVIQSLLRVSEEGTMVDKVCRHYLESIQTQQRPLFAEFMVDRKGCHIFESFVAVPTPSTIRDEGERAALSAFEEATPKEAPEGAGSLRLKRNSLAALEKMVQKLPSEESRDKLTMKTHLLECCAWGRALQWLVAAWPSEGAPSLVLPVTFCDGSEADLQRVRIILKAFALFAPSAMHLMYLWDDVFAPRLHLFWSYPSLLGALLTIIRKAALGDVANINMDTSLGAGELDSSSSRPAEGAEEQLTLRKELAQGAAFFNVPQGIQKKICDSICLSIKAESRASGNPLKVLGKSAAEFLLVAQGVMEEDTVVENYEEGVSPKDMQRTSPSSTILGPDVARYILRFHPRASLLLQHDIEKLRLEDLNRIARSRKGSLVLQQYLSVASLSNAASPTQDRQEKTASSSQAALSELNVRRSADMEKTSISRFYRRISPQLTGWAKDKYAGFVIEQLYKASSLVIKENIVLALKPLLEELLKAQKAKPQNTSYGAESEMPTQKEADLAYAIAKKVLQHCFVEQYTYRPDEWRKNAQKQTQVQQLMNQLTA